MATELQHRTNSLKKNKTTMNSNTSVFSPSHSRIPDDTVFFSLYPDTSLTTATSSSSASLSLQSLHLQILEFLSTLTSSYIWQHAPFTLSISLSPLPHLHGSLRFGDNIEDEWFLVYLLFQVSSRFSGLSIRVYDTDGEFLLIEAAFYLPRWINPETAVNRVFIRNGHVCIIPRKKLPNPNLIESLRFLIEHENEALVDEAVEGAIKKRISEYPERARKNVHFVRVRVPVSVAKVLKYEPCLISLAVEGFYDRDIDTMKYAAKMERFVPKGREEELVCVGVKMSRAMYAQLMQQKFQAPKCYPMPNRGEDVGAYLEAELGMKITCGFEMMYQQRKKEGKGSSWERYKDVLEKSGYFCGMLPGSLEYKRLLETAEEYYRNGSLFSRTSEMMNAPVRRIDEILTSSYSADKFKNQEVPPSDNDSWMYDGEDELNTSLQERQRELDIYNAKLKNKQKSGEQQDAVPSSSSNFDDFDLQDIAKSMRGFVEKMSSYKGAEVPEDRNLKEVDIDVERFLKDVESVFKRHDSKDNSRAVDSDEASSSDMEFDEFEDGSDVEEHMQKNEEGEESFMDTYTDALDEQLKDTTLKKSFIRGNDQSTKNIEGTSDAKEAMDEDEEFTPVDVDFNLVKNLLDSFSSQQGEPGPTSNLLGLMGLQLPQDSKKGK